MVDYDQALAAKTQACAQLLARRGVHGVGVGLKQTGGQVTNEIAIVVFVVEKKAPGDLMEGELIPPDLDGVKTDIIECPVPSPDAPDSGKHRPLEGGIFLQLPPGGTLGCFMTIPAMPNKVFGITNFHVAAPGRGKATNLRMIDTIVGATVQVALSLAAGTGSTITPVGSVAGILISIAGVDWVFYEQTSKTDTPTTIATRLLAKITAAAVPGITTVLSGTTFTFSSVLAGWSASSDFYGITLPNMDATLTASVEMPPSAPMPRIRLGGKAESDFYGIYTTVQRAGLNWPTQGSYIRVPKGQSLSDIANALAISLMDRGLNASASGAIVTVQDADAMECIVAAENRVGQPDDQFASECCDWCPDLIGLVVGARVDLDAALIELQPGTEYRSDIRDLTPMGAAPHKALAGSRALVASDMTNMTTLRKRGHTTLETSGMLTTLNMDGFVVPRAVPGDDNTKFSPRRYSNAFVVTAPPTVLLSDGGDSGSVWLDDRTVVGLHFGGSKGDPGRNIRAMAFAHHVEPILEAFGTTANPGQVVTNTADEQTLTVPAASGARSVRGETIQRMPSLGSETLRDRLRAVEAEVAATPVGRERLETVRRRVREAAQLVNRNRRVGVAWQRHGGPLLFKAVLDVVQHPDSKFPREVLGKPLDECIGNIAEALRAHATDEFVSDLDRFAPLLSGFGGRTYADLLERLQHMEPTLPAADVPRQTDTRPSIDSIPPAE